MSSAPAPPADALHHSGAGANSIDGYVPLLEELGCVPAGKRSRKSW